MSILQELLSADRVKLNLESKDKNSIIHELVSIMARNGLARSEDVEKDILEREEQMSTGLHEGVAVPHCKTDAVDMPQISVGIKKEGIDFGAIDGSPSNIFICLASPKSDTETHIKLFAEVGELLRQESVRSGLLDAATPEAAITALTAAECPA